MEGQAQLHDDSALMLFPVMPDQEPACAISNANKLDWQRNSVSQHLLCSCNVHNFCGILVMLLQQAMLATKKHWLWKKKSKFHYKCISIQKYLTTNLLLTTLTQKGLLIYSLTATSPGGM
jgi:hypothetical protein